MTEDQFWDLIDYVDVDALDEGDEEAAAEPLIEVLAELKRKRIQQFEEWLALALHRLDGRAFAEQAGEAGASGDGFLNARCYVVGCGRAHYEAVVNDPTQMSKSPDESFESLLFVAPQAWAESTGNDPDDWDYETSISYETGSNVRQW